MVKFYGKSSWIYLIYQSHGFYGISIPQKKLENVYIISPTSTKKMCVYFFGVSNYIKLQGGKDFSVRLMEEKPCTS